MTLPTFSPTAWQILATLINQPSAPTHLRGLSRQTGKSVRPVQLALEELEAARLISSTFQGNRRIFRVNRHHLFYPGLRLLIRAARPSKAEPPLTRAMVKAIITPMLASVALGRFELIDRNGQELLPRDGVLKVLISGRPPLIQLEELEHKLYQKLRRKVKIICQ